MDESTKVCLPSKSSELRNVSYQKTPQNNALLVSKLQQRLARLEISCRDKDEKIKKLTSSTQATYVNELKIQSEVYYRQMMKYRNELNNLNSNQNQTSHESTPSIVQPQRSFDLSTAASNKEMTLSLKKLEKENKILTSKIISLQNEKLQLQNKNDKLLRESKNLNRKPISLNKFCQTQQLPKRPTEDGTSIDPLIALKTQIEELLKREKVWEEERSSYKDLVTNLKEDRFLYKENSQKTYEEFIALQLELQKLKLEMETNQSNLKTVCSQCNRQSSLNNSQSKNSFTKGAREIPVFNHRRSYSADYASRTTLNRQTSPSPSRIKDKSRSSLVTTSNPCTPTRASPRRFITEQSHNTKQSIGKPPLPSGLRNSSSKQSRESSNVDSKGKKFLGSSSSSKRMSLPGSSSSFSNKQSPSSNSISNSLPIPNTSPYKLSKENRNNGMSSTFVIDTGKGGSDGKDNTRDEEIAQEILKYSDSSKSTERLNSSNSTTVESSNGRKCSSGNIKSIVHQAEVHADNSQERALNVDEFLSLFESHFERRKKADLLLSLDIINSSEYAIATSVPNDIPASFSPKVVFCKPKPNLDNFSKSVEKSSSKASSSQSSVTSRSSSQGQDGAVKPENFSQNTDLPQRKSKDLNEGVTPNDHKDDGVERFLAVLEGHFSRQNYMLYKQ